MTLPSWNLYKCKHVFTLLLFMYFVFVCPCRVVVACLSLFYAALLLLPFYLFIPFCYTDVVATFLFLFFDYVNKSIVFIFGAFIYHFNNIISIFVTIFERNARLWGQKFWIFDTLLWSWVYFCESILHRSKQMIFLRGKVHRLYGKWVKALSWWKIMASWASFVQCALEIKANFGKINNGSRNYRVHQIPFFLNA